MKTILNMFRLVIMFLFLTSAGMVQGQQRSSAEQIAKQHVAEIERIREMKAAAARTAEKERRAFDRAAELAKLCGLKCEIIFRVAGGEAKVGSNSPVLLLRATDLTREAILKAIKEDSWLTLRSSSEVLEQVNADVQGIANFWGLSEGNYLIVSEVRWLERRFLKNKKFGGIVFCSVALSSGQSASVVVTN